MIFSTEIGLILTTEIFLLHKQPIPSVNVMERDDKFELEVAVPGFEKKDFKVELNHNVLTISSDKKEEREDGVGKQYTRKEFSYLSFCRSFTIPDTINHEKIEARYENGILKVLIPKKKNPNLRNMQ
jgi:HSP20 family protein